MFKRSPTKALQRYIRVIPSPDTDVDCQFVTGVIAQLIEENPRVSRLVSPQNAPEGGFGLFLSFADADREFVLGFLANHGLTEAQPGGDVTKQDCE